MSIAPRHGRRHVLATMLGFASIAIGEARAAGSQKRKGKKHKKNECPEGAPHRCGRRCCSYDNRVCCRDRSVRGGRNCFSRGSHCCPSSLGGGACRKGYHCCPAYLHNSKRASCSSPEFGDFCCPPNSGGFCWESEHCCPTALTNHDNLGCCWGNEACCNVDADCNATAGERCLVGCCYAPPSE
jgi:hypothetical protein